MNIINLMATYTPSSYYDIYEAHPLKNSDQSMTHTIKVLDDIGYVQLVDCMPRMCPIINGIKRTAEFRIVEAARCSYGRGLKSAKEDLGLMKYLLRNRHTSPFEMVKFTFIVKCTQFTRTQLIRHRMTNINEFSLRYSEMPDEFYIPEMRMQSTDNKQGSKETGLTEDELKLMQSSKELYAETTKNSYDAYSILIKNGVAKELARGIIGSNAYTMLYVTFDLHNLMHFLKLRLDTHAQYEIRACAQAMYDLIKPIVPDALDAFNNYIKDSVVLYQKEINTLAVALNPDVTIKDLDLSKYSEREKEEFTKKFNQLVPVKKVSESTITTETKQ
jgi:thymidylate synthase (FAD)